MLWDQIAAVISQFWDYAYFMEDKRMLVDSTLIKFQISNETLQVRPVNKTQNIINFLNQISNETLKAQVVKDRFSIIIWAKTFIEKHNMVDNVKAKAEKMKK